MRFLLRIVLLTMLAVGGSIIVGSPVHAAGDSAENQPEYQLAILMDRQMKVSLFFVFVILTFNAHAANYSSCNMG